MTAPELTVQGFQPAELLDFACGATHWRYATVTSAVVNDVDSQIYQPQAGAKVGEIRVSRNALRAAVEIELPWSCPLVTLWMAGSLDAPVSILYYRGQDGAFAVTWRGWVKLVRCTEGRRALFSCVASSNELGNRGFALRCGRLCQVPLYSAACTMVLDLWIDDTGVVASVLGDEVTAAVFDTYDAGYFVGGPFTALGIGRMMIEHAGSTVRLDHAIAGLDAGATFTAAPGCLHTEAVCDGTFENLDNMRAQKDSPDLNFFKAGGV